MVKFTPTEQRMLDVLSDGFNHTPQELHACLGDELSSVENIGAHLTDLRKKLRPNGQEIICRRLRDGTFYQWCRVVPISE